MESTLFDSPAVQQLLDDHPAATRLLRAFAPLIEAHHKLAADTTGNDYAGTEELAAHLPKPDKAAFTAGRAWLPASDALPGTGIAAIYLDKTFLRAAPIIIAGGAARGFPEKAAAISTLGGFLQKHPAQCAQLTACHLHGTQDTISHWARQNDVAPELAQLFSVQLAIASARRVARAAAHQAELSACTAKNTDTLWKHWQHGYCPVCASAPDSTFLLEKNGARTLHCSLCGHLWHFSRSTCPACGIQALSQLPLFYLENRPQERAEACSACNTYLLGADLRECLELPPLELLLFCLAPLDELIQEKGFSPVAAARRV